MGWDYRLVNNNGHLGIHEAYYEGTNNRPHSITENGVSPSGESLHELIEDLKYMQAALQKPILEYAAFEKSKER